MMSGGQAPLHCLTARDMPLDDLIRSVRQVLHFSNTFRILALSWKAGECLDGFSKADGLLERSWRENISGELEVRYKRNKAEYVSRVKEGNRNDMEEAATNAGATGCLGCCLGFLAIFD